MKQAYLIAAHANPDQLRALINRLLSESEDDYVVLHLDRESALWRTERSAFAALEPTRIHLVESPAHVRWGHYSVVEMQYKLLDTACRIGFDVAHHISGADWPIVSRPVRMQMLLQYSQLPAFVKLYGQTQIARMQEYWWPNPTPSDWRRHPLGRRCWGLFGRWIHRPVNRLLASVGVSRSRPFGCEWEKGSGWWSLPHDIAEVVRDQLRSVLLSGRLRFTTCADEHVVPTIIASMFSDRIADYHRFIRWTPGLWSPDVLCATDVDEIRASNAWFARKVDLKRDDWFIRGHV